MSSLCQQKATNLSGRNDAELALTAHDTIEIYDILSLLFGRLLHHAFLLLNALLLVLKMAATEDENPTSDVEIDPSIAAAMGFAGFGTQPKANRRKYNPAIDAVTDVDASSNVKRSAPLELPSHLPRKPPSSVVGRGSNHEDKRGQAGFRGGNRGGNNER